MRSATRDSLDSANPAVQRRNGVTVACTCSRLVLKTTQSYVAQDTATTYQIRKTGNPPLTAKTTWPRRSIRTQIVPVFIVRLASARRNDLMSTEEEKGLRASGDLAFSPTKSLRVICAILTRHSKIYEERGFAQATGKDNRREKS